MMDSDRRITLEHFRTIVAVVECGSFVAAAQQLGRTQSALTHQVRTLEGILGERLLDRSRGHYCGLTAQGKLWLPHAYRVLDSLASACRAATLPLLSGRVRIGVMDDFRIEGLIGLIAQFKAIHADAEVSIISDLSASLEARLLRGKIDIALLKQVVSPGQAPSAQALRIEPLQWVAAQGFGRHGLPQPCPLVVFHQGCVYRKLMLEHLASLNIDTHIAYTGYGYHNVRAAIEAGLGLGILPQGQLSSGCTIVGKLGGPIPLPDLGFSELVLRVGSHRIGPIVSAFRDELIRDLTIPHV
ncbi:Cyn operon transcriptional activator [Delftia tsuruhatensis]|uniref:LysR family transcriptional regulator n=1 Tax=Delftia tsuruhatensis TaxID=180282 RepID=UPI001E7AC1E2|nr:LysR family transcriptional regulator [Delftia tsuruhatensis]CAB5670909.1 Cyn operon transcriptional activator [Delftia tsuruhatensis]CAC9683105.1 Cyn operon transcriptional activator [Delftia tsuruhatensis]